MSKKRPPGEKRRKRPGTARRNVLTREDVAEIRYLRAADPDHWSYSRLARAFGVSKNAIRLVCQAVGC